MCWKTRAGYTQYTPYQAEIAQGRLEALLNFQTMVSDLTGMDIANASLLDEGTAAAEAMHLCHDLHPERNIFFVSAECHPQTIDVVKTRARPLGIEIQVGDHRSFQVTDKVFGAVVQYPATHGDIYNYDDFTSRAHAAGALVAVATDLMSLTLLRPPGEFGADIAIGSAQRFGVPLGFGGPHAAYFATRDAHKRQIPGRIVGVSKDSRGRPALRLSLQTREQHIRREKATSNICTAQALLANMASLYAVYHGAEGLTKIADRIRRCAIVFETVLLNLGYKLNSNPYFDTLRISEGPLSAKQLHQRANAKRMNLRDCGDGSVCVSLDETTTEVDLWQLCEVFAPDSAHELADFFVWGLGCAKDLKRVTKKSPDAAISVDLGAFKRTSPFLTYKIFNSYHSETEMLRYIKRLESRDLSLTTSMIPLGSCTMKLNATVEMFPVSWPEFSQLHPYAPLRQAQGYQILFQQLEEWLAEITGFEAVSLQPNSGAQGEYAGLLVIREFHQERGQPHRNVCLIPQSAHGTNPASAVMAGMKVVAVACDDQGNINVVDLKAKAETHRDDLAALMVTYPSTHGVFENPIREICQIVHDHGGQVYMDGANMNAQVGLCRPADIGADVCHLNLHKTFCIPHGGGGPGMGPIGVAEHLVAFLPSHAVVNLGGESPIGAVSAAPGAAPVFCLFPGCTSLRWEPTVSLTPPKPPSSTPITLQNGSMAIFRYCSKAKTASLLTNASLIFANSRASRWKTLQSGLWITDSTHRRSSWPVPGTMMVEPTESESKEELDRFCEAIIGIHAEIAEIESGKADKQNNLLKNAPHPADVLVADKWERPYSREQAGFPAKWLHEHKFWPAVGRIDNVFGDRNLMCSCAGMDAYTS